MKRHKMEYIIVFLVFVLICLLPCIPKTTSKYVEKRSKKVTINAVQPTYTIHFDANGGSGTMDDQVFTYTIASNLHINTFTNDVGIFVDWNTEANGTGDSYADGASVYNLTSTNGATITLYAQWIDKVARIGDTYYDTLAEAILAAGDADEIILLKNTDENIVVANGQNITLNLGGHTIGNVGNDNTIKNYGTLTVKNGNVINNAATNGAINNYASGAITISGVNVNVYGTGNRQAFYNEKGVATITGGSNLTSKSTARPAVTNVSGGTMTINDATIVSIGASGLKNDGTLTLGSSGGDVSNTNPSIKGINYGLETSKNVIFYDGILMGQTRAVDNPNKLTSVPIGYLAVDGEEEISGSLYYEKYVDVGVIVTFDPNGGHINTADATKAIGVGKTVGTLPEATKSGKLFDGWYTEVEEGDKVLPTTTVSEDKTFHAHWMENSCVAKIGETMYNSLQEAVDAASDTEVTSIELLKDISEAVVISDTKNIELTLGDKTISNSGNAAVITNNGSLNIHGGLITSSADFAAIDNLAGVLNITDLHVSATGSRQAIYVSSGEVTISGNSYLSSTATGNASYSTLQRATVQCLSDGVLNITGGTIVAEKQNAVSNEGILTIGVKDGIVGTITPTLIGKIDGIKSVGILNFYDGIIKGKTDAIVGDVSDIEIDTTVVHETVDGYKVAYLEENNPNNTTSAPTNLLFLASPSIANEDDLDSDMTITSQENIIDTTNVSDNNELDENDESNNIDLTLENINNDSNEKLEDETIENNEIVSETNIENNDVVNTNVIENNVEPTEEEITDDIVEDNTIINE